jgi:hypothetical protein
MQSWYYSITDVAIYNGVVYCIVADSLYYTADQGASWNRFTSQPDSGLRALAADQSGVYLISGNSDLYNIPAPSNEWQKVGNLASLPSINSIASNGKQIALGTVDGIYLASVDSFNFQKAACTNCDSINDIALNDSILVAAVNYKRIITLGVDGPNPVKRMQRYAGNDFHAVIVNYNQIRFSLPVGAMVCLNMYDSRGRMVYSEKHYSAKGGHQVQLPRLQVASEMYLLDIKAGDYSSKFMLPLSQ